MKKLAFKFQISRKIKFKHRVCGFEAENSVLIGKVFLCRDFVGDFMSLPNQDM